MRQYIQQILDFLHKKFAGKMFSHARIDGVISGNQFLVMELELIEPWFFPKFTDYENLLRMHADHIVKCVGRA